MSPSSLPALPPTLIWFRQQYVTRKHKRNFMYETYPRGPLSLRGKWSKRTQADIHTSASYVHKSTYTHLKIYTRLAIRTQAHRSKNVSAYIRMHILCIYTNHPKPYQNTRTYACTFYVCVNHTNVYAYAIIIIHTNILQSRKIIQTHRIDTNLHTYANTFHIHNSHEQSENIQT